jgi:hypothetical protein
MIGWKTEGTRLYQSLPAQLFATSQPCEPLRKKPAGKKTQKITYKTWKHRKDAKE